MTTDREVMQQALERLALYHAANGFAADAQAIAALRARLAEPETCKPALQVERTDPRRPLTDEEIKLIVNKSVEGVTVSESVTFRAVARAIERAHKIGGNDD
jgi:hypothetical protein